jgi:preprotein translocase subunit SecE
MNKIIAFWEDLKKEMAKVSWPSLPELRESTVVVVMYSIVVSILIFAIDKVYSSILGFLYQ